jgi:hypothetical protein
MRAPRVVWLFLGPAIVLTWSRCASAPPEPESSSAAPELATPPASPVAPVAPAPEAPSCEALMREAVAPIDAVVEAHGRCEFDVDCVAAPGDAPCLLACDRALRPEGLDPLRDAFAAVTDARCPALARAGCALPPAVCAVATARCVEGRCAMRAGDAPPMPAPIPEENALGRADDPPPRPPADERTQARARRLFEAVVRDDPRLAQDLFFPREAFRHVKGIADPDGYWQRLFARYQADVRALHAALPGLERAEFERLEVVRRGGWVRPGEEANRLPYWVARHNLLHYRIDGAPRSFEVRVLITWGDRWYVTHLSEFH